jgi:hypothetical protein
MRVRGPAVLAGSILFASSLAGAVVPRTTGVPAETLTALPAASTAKPLRVHRQLQLGPRATPAWNRFAAVAGPKWRVAWDRATLVPSRLWGPGLRAPGSSASAAIAEQFARAVLADHLALLAPGARVEDFVLVANHTDGEIRSIGFVQHAGGRRVVGGQVSFRFKRDRLFVIGSEALPDVKVIPGKQKLSRQALETAAATELRVTLALPRGTLERTGTEVVLPLVADDAVLGYRVAVPLELDGGAAGRYLAYVDPATARPLAVHQLNHYANGTVKYRGVDRHPGRLRIDRPAANAHVTLGGNPMTTSSTGTLSWSPEAPLALTTNVLGSFVTIVNKAGDGVLASAQLQLTPNGTTLWDASPDALIDAQVQTFLATDTVKRYVRDKIDPAMPGLDIPTIANVNVEDVCNAFFDGESINFFQSSERCQNTGLLEDVVFHEFGHALHTAEIIEGVGSFDGALSEGASDFLSASITGDPAMGRGFFFTDEPLRHLDPEGIEPTWPRDIGEVHTTGIIFGGLFWDLRKAMIAKLGAVEGERVTNKLFVATLRRATSIPTSMVEALAADDDDGDLTNGTPNECVIRDAYGRHGLRTATGTIRAPGASPFNAEATVVRVELDDLSSRCSGDEIEFVTLVWRPSFTAQPTAGSAPMTPLAHDRFWATLPLAVDAPLYYTAKIQFTDGSVMSLPDNIADSFYTVYQGQTVELYCTDFEDRNPFSDGWVTTGEGRSRWEWGEAESSLGSDPPFAYSGTKLLAQGIGSDYEPDSVTSVTLPPIDVGQYSDVRLQFRRWLAVEDSFFDQARVTVNGRQAWINFSANEGDASSIHHIDKEWRFQDVGVSGYTPGKTIRAGFELATDGGLELGGWALDDVCLVANVKSICGDGVKSVTEACDLGLGNSDAPSAACRTYCMPAQCGDAILDRDEECDHGMDGDESCNKACELIDTGCCSTGGSPTGAGLLSLLVGWLLSRRARRT